MAAPNIPVEIQPLLCPGSGGNTRPLFNIGPRIAVEFVLHSEIVSF